MPFHAKSGSGLADPCVSAAAAESHKHLIASLAFSAKQLSCRMQWNPLSVSRNERPDTAAILLFIRSYWSFTGWTVSRGNQRHVLTFDVFVWGLFLFVFFGSTWLNHGHYKLQKEKSRSSPSQTPLWWEFIWFIRTIRFFLKTKVFFTSRVQKLIRLMR